MQGEGSPPRKTSVRGALTPREDEGEGSPPRPPEDEGEGSPSRPREG